MPAIILHTATKEGIGFLLLTGEDLIAAEQSSRDAILSGFPRDASLFDHPLAQTLLAHKHIEYDCRVSHNHEGLLLIAGNTDTFAIHVTLQSTGEGEWHFTLDGSELEQGYCKLVDKK